LGAAFECQQVDVEDCVHSLNVVPPASTAARLGP
jgi:hypothetical protein